MLGINLKSGLVTVLSLPSRIKGMMGYLGLVGLRASMGHELSVLGLKCHIPRAPGITRLSVISHCGLHSHDASPCLSDQV